MSIAELEEFFKDRELPRTIELQPNMMIMDVPLFVSTTLNTLKQPYANGIGFAGYHPRLLKLANLLANETPAAPQIEG